MDTALFPGGRVASSISPEKGEIDREISQMISLSRRGSGSRAVTVAKDIKSTFDARPLFSLPVLSLDDTCRIVDEHSIGLLLWFEGVPDRRECGPEDNPDDFPRDTRI